MQPLFERGHILADGAVVNNVPADIVAQRYDGRIIIVVVTLTRNLPVPESYDDLVPSGWQILWHRINPFLEPLKLPTIVEILQRSTAVGAHEADSRSRKLADLSIFPPVGGTGLLDFRDIDGPIKIGYEYAASQLKDIGKGGLQALFPGLEIVQPETQRQAEGRPPIDRAHFHEIVALTTMKRFAACSRCSSRCFPARSSTLRRRSPMEQAARRGNSRAAPSSPLRTWPRPR